MVLAEMTGTGAVVRCGAVTAFISTYDRKSVEIKMSVRCSKSANKNPLKIFFSGTSRSISTKLGM